MSKSMGTFGAFTLGEANSDLSSATFKAVRLNTSGKVVVCGAGEFVQGVLQNKPQLNEGCTVAAIAGSTSKLVVDGTTPIAIGDRLKADASGRGVKTTTAQDEVIGLALEASTAAGDNIEAQLFVGRR